MVYTIWISTHSTFPVYNTRYRNDSQVTLCNQIRDVMKECMCTWIVCYSFLLIHIVSGNPKYNAASSILVKTDPIIYIKMYFEYTLNFSLSYTCIIYILKKYLQWAHI